MAAAVAGARVTTGRHTPSQQSPGISLEGLFDEGWDGGDLPTRFDDEEELERDLAKLRHIADDIWNHFRPPQVSIDGAEPPPTVVSPPQGGALASGYTDEVAGTDESEHGAQGNAPASRTEAHGGGAGVDTPESSTAEASVVPLGRATPPAPFASIDMQELSDEGNEGADHSRATAEVLRPMPRRAAEGEAALTVHDAAVYVEEADVAADSSHDVITPHCPEETELVQPVPVYGFRDMAELKRNVVALMEDPHFSPLAQFITAVVFTFIIISTITIVVETLPQYDNDESRMHFFIVECFAIFVFTLEYVIRLWAYEDKKAYMLAPLNVIDLVAILPFYIDLVILIANVDTEGGALKLLRLFRLIRVLRIFKLSRYNSNIVVCANAMIESQDTLGLMGFMLSIVVVVFSAFIFYFEHGEEFTVTKVLSTTQNVTHTGYKVENVLCTATYAELQADPKACYEWTQFQSIPGAFWWTLVTMMTVGYGDLYPVSYGGKLVATVAMLCSIVILALPISVIGANFSRAWMERKELDERYMDGHEVSIVYRNLIHNIGEHNSILEDILGEGSVNMTELQKQLVAAKVEYNNIRQSLGAAVAPRDDGLPPAVEPSETLAKILGSIDTLERKMLEDMERVQMVQNHEFNQAVTEAIDKCLDMERVVAEQCMLSAKIEAKETAVMGRVLAVPSGP